MAYSFATIYPLVINVHLKSCVLFCCHKMPLMACCSHFATTIRVRFPATTIVYFSVTVCCKLYSRVLYLKEYNVSTLYHGQNGNSLIEEKQVLKYHWSILSSKRRCRNHQHKEIIVPMDFSTELLNVTVLKISPHPL